MIEVGQTIIVRNCKIPVVNQHMRMQVDTFGKIELSKVSILFILNQNFVVEIVNQLKDRSVEEYDNFGKTGISDMNEGSAYQGLGGFRGGRGGRFSGGRGRGGRGRSNDYEVGESYDNFNQYEEEY